LGGDWSAQLFARKWIHPHNSQGVLFTDRGTPCTSILSDVFPESEGQDFLKFIPGYKIGFQIAEKNDGQNQVRQNYSEMGFPLLSIMPFCQFGSLAVWRFGLLLGVRVNFAGMPVCLLGSLAVWRFGKRNSQTRGQEDR